MNGLDGLNPSQRDAVTTLSGPLLVLAGAGTGKTRVITYRMAALIRNGVPPERILSVTFTNKAAKEMRQRTADLLGRRRKTKPHISTFHSLCVGILRKHIPALGYPANFSIYDRGDQESAARKALRDIRLDEKSLKPGDLLNKISGWKMAGVGPKRATDYVENDLDYLAAVAYRKYQQNIRASGAVDFDDLLLLTLQLFEECPDVLASQQERFDHVQIDEYQDTNGVQFRLVEAFVEKHRCLCVVGDDDQSIYGWRGADVEHILKFASHFPGAKVVRLQDNYRCTDRILDLANRLVRHNKHRHDKKLVAHKQADAEVRFLEYPDEQSEAESVVREIRYYVEQQNVSAGDFAVLFRTNEQPRLFESEFRRAGLPYVLVGGQSFFDRKEIRDLMAYIKAISQPADEVSLLRIINTPARGIGASSVEKVLSRAVRQKTSFWDAIPGAIAASELSSKAAAAIADFRALLERYRARFESAPGQMDRTLHDLIEEIDYESEISKQYKEADQQLLRSSILDQLVDSAAEYVSRADEPTLHGFLEDSALDGREDDSSSDEKGDARAVKLMTLHSAKGLEFPRVYLVGLEEGLLPHRRSVEINTEAAISEERRLTYVGITRAMNELTITRAAARKKWGKMRQSIPSRFLYEMQGRAPAGDAETAAAG